MALFSGHALIMNVGFALPEKLWAEFGATITREDVIQKAKKALQPFTLEFKSVDWWTVYSVGQRLSGNYRNDRVFIAGDAAHTNSSGAAQGINTGLHDAVNLSWKLAGCINGWLTKSVLDTYDAERRSVAKSIIEQDKIISVLTGGEISHQFKKDPDADPHKTLTDTYKANASLNTGLGIAYPCDGLTVLTPEVDYEEVTPGWRVPDVLLQKAGIRLPVRLQSLTKFSGKFTIMVFCGDPTRTHASIKTMPDTLVRMSNFTEFSAGIQGYITVVASDNEAGSPNERLGVPCFGRAYFAGIVKREDARQGNGQENGDDLVTENVKVSLEKVHEPSS